jgi:hypothetical protein
MQLRCRSCGNQYGLEQFADVMDDLWEAILADIPCDRL